MPKYDTKNFGPPAPVAYVTLRHPVTGASITNIPMLLDTGADVTLVPIEALDKLGIDPAEGDAYEVQGFGGDSHLIKAVNLEMILLGKKFTGQFLSIDQPIEILGGNILNSVSILMDGNHLKWDEYKK
jgi:predicted aspartyl protease